MLRSIWISLASLLIAACSGLPSSSQSDFGPTPAEVLAGEGDQVAVHWGGRIVQVENLSDKTRIEVLAFPLEASGEPRVDRASQRRFIAEKDGFLEPKRYAPDRRVDIRGTVSGIRVGHVGEAAYRFPVVDADEINLWPDAEPSVPASSRKPRINFGIGIGTHGSGGSIGIGF